MGGLFAKLRFLPLVNETDTTLTKEKRKKSQWGNPLQIFSRLILETFDQAVPLFDFHSHRFKRIKFWYMISISLYIQREQIFGN